MCWYHMITRVDINLSSTISKKATRNELRKDIEFVQLSSTRKEFDCLIKLMYKKYQDFVETEIFHGTVGNKTA
jgi:hypothetical protein